MSAPTLPFTTLDPEPSSLVCLTDEHGNKIVHLTSQPQPGSVVLMHGDSGTAWQRHFADGLWHSSRGGRPHTWTWLMGQRNVVLVYVAPIDADRG